MRTLIEPRDLPGKTLRATRPYIESHGLRVLHFTDGTALLLSNDIYADWQPPADAEPELLRRLDLVDADECAAMQASSEKRRARAKLQQLDEAARAAQVAADEQRRLVESLEQPQGEK